MKNVKYIYMGFFPKREYDFVQCIIADYYLLKYFRSFDWLRAKINIRHYDSFRRILKRNIRHYDSFRRILTDIW